MYQSVPKGTADGNAGLLRPVPREEVGLYPTSNECLLEILNQAKHSSAVEYFLHHLHHGYEDYQRPHDLVGEGNKFDTRVISYLALEYRVPRVDCQIIRKGVEIHRRGQEHHRRVNGYALSPSATDDFLLEGMVDAACAIRENRIYAKNRAYNYHDVSRIFAASGQPPHKILFMGTILCELIDLENVGFGWPNLGLLTREDITGDNPIPNYFGLPKAMHQAIDERVKWAVSMVRNGGYERAWQEMDKKLCFKQNDFL